MTSDKGGNIVTGHTVAKEAGMAAIEKARTIDLLAALSQGSNFSVGCYCENEERCHRSVLKELLIEKGAVLVEE